jgi:hypothetical protein
MEFLMATLLQLWTALQAIFHWLTFGVDNEASAAVIAIFWGYLGVRAKPVLTLLIFIVRVFKDKLLSDTEAAGLLWNIAAVIYGWLPGVNRGAILQWAPPHWHSVIIDGKKPGFELVAVPLNKLDEVRRLIGSAAPVKSVESQPGGA